MICLIWYNNRVNIFSYRFEHTFDQMGTYNVEATVKRLSTENDLITSTYITIQAPLSGLQFRKGPKVLPLGR